MKPTNLARHLTNYLTAYLPGRRGMSSNTIKSYRDTFCLLLTYSETVHRLPAEKLTIERIDKKFIEGFLDWLENERGNSISTRNQRLAAIHAFFKYLQYETPDFLLLSQQNMFIPTKKCTKPELCYLSCGEVKEMLSKPDRRTMKGRRDLLILSLLYDTGARVSELIDLTAGDVRLDDLPSVSLTGKGNKTRRVPLMSNTALILKQYLEENKLGLPSKKTQPIFMNVKNSKFTRVGITYILQKYAPAGHEKITPHIIRHTKAMHLLQAGVNIVYIRDILGHADVSTTEIYARADTEMKRVALEKAYIPQTQNREALWQANPQLMDWLKSLA
jgi:integrase/recombinase XerD